MKLLAKIHKNRTYNYIIRFAIVIGTYGFIYKQIFHKKKLEAVVQAFAELLDEPKIYIFTLWVFGLMLVNWGIESLKWQFLISKIEKIPFVRSFMAVLAGVSVSAFTPNRVGEYFGRVFILEKGNPWQGVFITIIGSMSQLLTTIIVGSVALLFFVQIYLGDAGFYSDYLYYAMVFLVLVIVTSLILIFLNVSTLPRIIGRYIRKRFIKIYRYFAIIGYYSTYELAIVLTYSFLRYCIFAIQFYILLLMFSVEIPLMHGLMIISIVFFVMTAIPTVTLAELGIRGSVSLYFIGLYFERFSALNEQINAGIISSSSTLWLINLAIPALLGTFFVFRLKFFNKRPKDD